MKKIAYLFLGFLFFVSALSNAQSVMTPEKLLEVGRVSGMGISVDNQWLIYGVKYYDVRNNTGKFITYKVPVEGGEAMEIDSTEGLLNDSRISPDGKYKISSKDVKINKVYGSDYFPEMKASNMMIYDDLNYRHWDTFEDGAFGHVFVHKKTKDGFDEGVDIMPNEPFDCPQKPFGGDEDFIWSADSKKILYVSKKYSGVEYANSTNTDIYAYDLGTKKTRNLTADNKGYDVSPAYSDNGQLAWLQMKRDGYESDKNDIVVRNKYGDLNLTQHWDGTVNSFIWSADNKHIYFTAAIRGTVQLFVVDNPGLTKKMPVVKQVTNGQFDIRGIIGQVKNRLFVARSDMNHATEIYVVDVTNGKMKQLTHVNDNLYASVKMGSVRSRITKATDGADLFSWVIYPPNFDASKKYPVLLYLQGGPQGALSQFYSFRWNFQLMAANGYIVLAPNRRGMPGFGVKWNEDISKNYGGQCMDDYLSAIDDFANESYVDKTRIGAIGASFGGYSAFYLMGHHEGRFKTFISHDGIFDWYSMYGTTEEMFFINWDIGGPYWDKENEAAQRGYNEYNPLNFVDKWDRPILIIQGGVDYRVPIGQGLAAFNAAKLKGLKSRLLFFPQENHWVLQAQNSLIWQKEFYRWLKETL